MKNREFAKSAFLVILGAGLIGFALKFSTYFDDWYWLPTWPNIGDTIFIIIAGLVLIFFAIPREIRSSRFSSNCEECE